MRSFFWGPSRRCCWPLVVCRTDFWIKWEDVKRPHCLISSSSISFSLSMLDILVYKLHSSLNISLFTTIWVCDIKSSITSYSLFFYPWLVFDLLDHLCTWGRSPWLNQTKPTDWLADCLYWMVWPIKPTTPTEPIYQANYLIRKISEQWYWYQSELNWRSIKNDGLTEWYSWL